jgi:hypothetical protein
MSGFDTTSSLMQAFFTTNVNPSNFAGVSTLPINGRFNQDFSTLKTTLQQKFGNNFEIFFAAGQTFFLQKEVLSNSTPPYTIFIGYTDVNLDTWFMATGLNLPLSSSTTGLSPIPLYRNGNPLSTVAPYQIVQGQYGQTSLYLQPVTATTSLQLPQTIQIYINANLVTSPTSGITPYLLTGYQINNALYPSTIDQTITIPIPAWTAYPYWAQQIVAVTNNDPSVYAASAGGYPSTTVPMKQYFSLNDQAILPVDGSTPNGSPSCMVQIEISVLDVSYVGNATTGQILQLLPFDPKTVNNNIFTAVPSFFQQTRQPATSFLGGSQIQFAVTDRTGQPFLSLLSAYDITSQVIVEARDRRANTNSLF